MEEKQHIGQLFDRIAGTYDGLNHGLSLNIDRLWRRKTVALMQPAKHVLDVAIGTADLTIEMFRQHKAEQVTGIDLSDQMMAIGQKKISNLQSQISNVQFVHANAQAMPFEDASFDAVTCAFGCRNFSNLDEGLREMYRVLKPGGKAVILELSLPSNRVVRWFYDLYFMHILPWIGGLISGDKAAYKYLPASVHAFPAPSAFLAMMQEAGFQNVYQRPFSFGLCRMYVGEK